MSNMSTYARIKIGASSITVVGDCRGNGDMTFDLGSDSKLKKEAFDQFDSLHIIQKLFKNLSDIQKKNIIKELQNG